MTADQAIAKALYQVVIEHIHMLNEWNLLGRQRRAISTTYAAKTLEDRLIEVPGIAMRELESAEQAS